MKSYSKPTSEQLDTAIPLLSSPQHEAYFFAGLENPHWIVPLAQRDVFKYPPKAEHVEGGGIRFPVWSPSRYLVRMAAQAPTEVVAIFAKIETDNASIIGDIVNAAMAMPSDVSVSLVPAICKAAREGALWIHFDNASDLCVRLAEGGQLDAAMSLAEALFTPAFEEGQEEPTRRDEYWYDEGIKKVVPVMVGAYARVFLPELCDWLKASVGAKRYVDPISGSDNSDMWRPAIEEHEQNQDCDFAGVMVGFVREGFEQAIRSGCLSLDEAIQIVAGYPYLIFRRIRLHLIGEFAEQNRDLARQVMLDRALFEDHGCKHEHAMLIGKRFNMLEPDQQAEWLRWVKDGPTGKVAEHMNAPDDPDLSQRRGDYWRFERLHWVRDHLTGAEQHFYQGMRQKHGEPHMADLNVWMGPVRDGPDSPMTVNDFAGMTFEQAVDKVSSWKPEEPQFMGPDIEGLASTFEEYVATNPEQFSEKARILINRPASFVREFIAQMADAVKGGREIDLPAVLDLCHWVLSRPIEERTVPEQEHGALVDKDWQWTRDDISRLLENICKAKAGDVPKYSLDDLQQPIWRLIECLCHDRAESYMIRDVSQDDPRVYDYLNPGLNSPRGKAVGAALEYARWVANRIKQSDGKQDVVPGGFKVVPEVRDMLEWQIAKENRSFEVMSVIGSQIALIYWIDKQWLTENTARLFDLEAIEQTPSAAHGWAAWNAFLVWTRPHIEFYRIFKPQFAYAVQQAAKVELTECGDGRPMHHLGKHLVILYGRGQLGLDDDEGLLRRFLLYSNADVRRHAIFFVGQTLEGDKGVPPQVIERFMTLWDLYWAGPGKSDAKDKPHSVLFGMWFSCGRFPEQWALDRLESFVEVAPTPEPDGSIAAKLAESAHVDIVKSVRILDRIMRGDREGWRIERWLESTIEILRLAMGNPGEAREQAVALVNYLGRRGYTQLGQLLGGS
ncbi:MAG: hypothetical protein NTZ17_14250 [Phycisphaerae bacterium]|nr:hypothetical protein [Phycisphaerae bacterium]